MFKHSFFTLSIPLAALIAVTACSSSTSVDEVKSAPLTPVGRVETAATAADNAILFKRQAANVQAESVLANTRGVTLPQVIDTPIHIVIEDRENYDPINTNPIIVASTQPTSTFSVDVDSGSYANVRRFLNSGSLPPIDAVRVEEMINYFSYDYPIPDNTDIPFSINTEMAVNPWNENTHLLQVGLKAYEVTPENRPAANLVFLIDVSGSMAAHDKLGLVKPALKMLVNQLTKKDTLSIALYAGASGTALEPTSADNKQAIANAIDSLAPGGSTNGRAGIELAYDLAAQNYKDDGVNRVILVTDGDFNVGMSDVDKLKQLIEQKRRSGIALTTLGFGTGNYNDHLMEQLADAGNGHYAYIDTLNEARKVLADEASSTLLTVAKDVKIQVEFNPAVVSEYRLIGYENRHLANEDFNNDKVDAGDIGAGHTVTALYEIALVGRGGERNTESRYGNNTATPNQALDEIAELRLRYKTPDTDTSKLLTNIVRTDDIIDNISNTSTSFRFATSVAAFGQQLRGGKYLNNFSNETLIELVTGARGEDKFGYRQEFLNLIRLAGELNSQNEQALSRTSKKDLEKPPRG